MKKALHLSLKTTNILLTIAVLAILPVVVFTLVSSKTNIIYGIKSFVILTGSMEPNLPAGSVIYTQPATTYKLNDVIAFNQTNRTVTHRIAQVKGANTYITKGDANNVQDSDPVSSASIIGKQVFSIPYLGSFILFLSTLPGFILFIVIPIAIFIAFEIWNIKKEIDHHIAVKVMEKMPARLASESVAGEAIEQ